MSALPDLVIVGAGGHGRELFDAVAAANRVAPTWRVLGFVDDAPTHVDRVERLGSHVLGDLRWLERHPCRFALGIGDPARRRELAHRFESAGMEPATVVHPGATVGPDVELGPGVVLYDRCTLTTDVRVGRHTHLNVACAVQHDSVLGEFVQVSPGVLVNGDCRVDDGAFLGSGAVVTRGCRVGASSRVGAGAVVLADVPAGVTAVGVPARPVGGSGA